MLFAHELEEMLQGHRIKPKGRLRRTLACLEEDLSRDIEEDWHRKEVRAYRLEQHIAELKDAYEKLRENERKYPNVVPKSQRAYHRLRGLIEKTVNTSLQEWASNGGPLSNRELDRVTRDIANMLRGIWVYDPVYWKLEDRAKSHYPKDRDSPYNQLLVRMKYLVPFVAQEGWERIPITVQYRPTNTAKRKYAALKREGFYWTDQTKE